MKGLFHKGTGMAGFIDQINALRDTSSREDKIESIRLWMDRMWESGVQAMADISNCDDSFGIKASHKMYTRTFLEVFGTEPKDCPKVMENVGKLKEKAESYGLDAAPTPHAVYTMSPELIRAASEAGLRSGFLSYHSEESPEEEEMLEKGSGKMWENRKAAGMSVPPVTGKSSLLYFLDRLLEIHPAPIEGHVLLVHEVCMNQEGIDAMNRVLLHPYVALCPKSNIYIHNMLPPVELMRRNHLDITIGTDSLSSNDDLDMVAEMRLLQENFPGIGTSELLEWACRNGASFLGKDDIFGSIEPKKKPGLVAVAPIGDNGVLLPESKSHRII
jgi:cytosine/adenosine deaminase-related metal-dependent hydrolase